MGIMKDLLLILIILFLFIRNFIVKNEIIKQRNYFIDTLRHDLRVSTIAQIRGLELLQKQNLDLNNAEFIEEISNSCKFSLEMINMLLNTYQYENGEDILDYEEFNVSEVLYSACNLLNSALKNKKLAFVFDVEKLATINADKIGIQKVLMIFLATAINNAEYSSNLNIFILAICERTV